ncbi:MAG: peptidyl-prolyl cis-trans isomerase [Armatimonadetes bacterium]|nr:peptidyl-prolyl cis-trans isomerase [Armatimonadota bacterium]
MKLGSLCTAFSLCVVAVAQTPDAERVVVTINGEAVNASEYYSRMEFLQGVGTILGGRFVEMPPAFITLERIINDRLILQLAEQKGVTPTPGEIENELNRRKAEDPERFQRLSELGVSEDRVKAQLAVEMAQFNLLTAGVTVTDEQVEEHYNTNKLIYTTRATVKLRVIVVKTAVDMAKVDEALRTRPFADVAREMSTDITQLSGGDLPEVRIGALPQNVLNEVSRTPADSDTSWIESEGSFSKYRVERKTPAKQLPLDDKLKISIRRRLMVDIGRNRNDVRALLDGLRKTSEIQIASQGLQKLWEKYRQEYLRAPGGQDGPR